MNRNHAILLAAMLSALFAFGCGTEEANNNTKTDTAGGGSDSVVADGTVSDGAGQTDTADTSTTVDVADTKVEDVPDSTVEDTPDSTACTAGTEGCECKSDKTCDGDLACKGGTTCVKAADCPAGELGCDCKDGGCAEGDYCKGGKTCVAAADCPAGDEGCACDEKGACGTDLYCKEGKTCAKAEACPNSAAGCPCTAEKGCDGGLYCSAQNGTCATKDTCPKGTAGCPCDTTNPCGADLACGAGGVCSSCPFGTDGCPCKGDSTCDAGYMCQTGACAPDPCYGKEGTVGCGCKDGGCDKDAWCNSGTCQICKADGPGCACNDKAPCGTELTCGSDSTCKPCADNAGAPGCKPKGDGTCGDGNTLNPATGLCETCAPGKLGCECDSNKACAGDYKCKVADNVCVACKEVAGCPCQGKADCGNGYVCDNATQSCGACEAGTAGCDCKGTGVAACVDGYTCNIGVCEACKPGKLGCPLACNVEFPAPVKIIGKTTCSSCPGNCMGVGETGVAVTGQTQNGSCICETKEGYFYEATTGKAEPCDGDGDGWIRQTALDAMRSNDPVIKANARCGSVMREMDYVALVTEAGIALPIPVTSVLDAATFKQGTLNQDGKGGLVMAEPLLFDSESLLASQVSSGGFPNLAGGRPPHAAELNPLTKSCVSASADFNGNNIADVEEWSGHGKAKLDPMSQIAIKFSYWIELHRGWWADVPVPVSLPAGATPVDTTNAPKEGVYFIAEKQRALNAAAPTQTTLMEPTTTSQGYWRQCKRMVAKDYKTAVDNGSTTIGFDFAEWSSYTQAFGEGMTHHSQFHCAVIAANDAVLTESEKQFKIRASELENKWVVNDCKYGANSHTPLPTDATQITMTVEGKDIRNPADPVSSGCSVATPSTGATYWLVSRYQAYLSKDGYNRGCVNECIDQVVETCPYVLDDPYAKYACVADPANSGQAQCTCNNGYYGTPQTKCESKCGDGIIAPFDEVCDDGNTKTNDGCSDKCQCEGWSKPVLSEKTGTNGYKYKVGTCQCADDGLAPKIDLVGQCGGKAVDLGTIAKSGTATVESMGRVRFGETEDWYRVYAPDKKQVPLGSGGVDTYDFAVDLSLASTPDSDKFVVDIFRSTDITDSTCKSAAKVCADEPAKHTFTSLNTKCYRGGSAQTAGCGSVANCQGTPGNKWKTIPPGAKAPTGGYQYGMAGPWPSAGSTAFLTACPDYTAYYFIRVKRAANTPTTCGQYKLKITSKAD